MTNGGLEFVQCSVIYKNMFQKQDVLLSYPISPEEGSKIHIPNLCVSMFFFQKTRQWIKFKNPLIHLHFCRRIPHHWQFHRTKARNIYEMLIL
jgi:hypothetical protein